MLRRTLLLGAAAVALTGCASSMAVKGTLSPEYKSGSIESMSILPILYASKAAAYTPSVQAEVALALGEKNKNLRIMSTNETLTRLMTGDAAQQARNMSFAVFDRTAINKEEVAKLHKVLGVDAVVVSGYGDLPEEKLVKMSLYIVDLRSGEVIWSGESAQWLPAAQFGSQFGSDMSVLMQKGLESLHKLMPAL